MKFTLSWLRAHLETTAGLDEITDRLTGIGLELESVSDPGAALAAFRVAEVLEAKPHPNADRLRACTVDAGDGPVSVVCGAPNARTGMKAVFAPPGSFIPGTGLTLKVGEIRGVVSAGMLLSAREMGLGDDHAGIIELPGDAPVGAAYPDYAGLADPVIEIAVTPNRGDAFAVRGVARDLAASGLGRLLPWGVAAVPGTFESPVRWAIEGTAACPWVLGRTVRGVRNGPSPEWLRRRLLAIGLRPINALVDVTNLFCFDLGRPLHVFDVDRVAGPVLTMRPGRPGAGESLAALNGKTYVMDPADCVIADASGAVSLGGIMGGEATGCTEATNSVFIECALFDPVAVALSGRRHQIVSDARQRFERGVDASLLPGALEAATLLIQEICGGEASHVVSAGAEPDCRRSATLRFSRLRELGGEDVPADEAVGVLERLGFGVEARDAGRVTVAVPPWRNDVAAGVTLDPAAAFGPNRVAELLAAVVEAEPEADLVEEVLRIRGLDRVPPVSLPVAGGVPEATLTARQVRAALVRRHLAAAGLLECVTFSFVDGATAARFGGGEAALRVANPISADLDQMRPTPVATLALAAARNAARGQAESLLCEVGPAFREAGQEVVAAGVLQGVAPRGPGVVSRAYGAMDAKGVAMAALGALGLPPESLSVTADAAGWYHPGQSGVVRQGPKLVLASFGALHPAVCAALDLPGGAAAFELFLDRVPEPKRRRRAAPELSPYQPVRRDFAFLVAAEVPADAVLRAARGAERGLIAEARVFDVFAGGAVPAGLKSVGVEVVFQPRERTLTEGEIEGAAAKVVAAVVKGVGGVLRE